MICEPVNQTTLQRVLDALGWSDRDGNPLSQRMAKPLRERIIDNKLVDKRQNNLTCHPDLLEPLTRETVADGTFIAIVEAAEQVVPTKPHIAWQQPSDERRLRLLRIALFGGREDEVFQVLGLSPDRTSRDLRYVDVEPLARIFTRSTDRGWLDGLAPRIKIVALVPLLRESALDLVSQPNPYRLMEQHLPPLVEGHVDAADALAEQRLMRGRLVEVPPLLDGRDDADAMALQGWLQFLQGAYPAAIEHFDASLAAKRKLTRKRNLYLPGIPGALHLLALLHRGERADFVRVQKQVTACLRASVTDPIEPAYRLLGELAMLLAGQRRAEESAWLQHDLALRGAFPLLLQSLALNWIGKRPSAGAQETLAILTCQAADAGLYWYAHEAASLLQVLGFDGEMPMLPESLERMVPMTSLLSPKPAWEIALDALKGLGSCSVSGEPAAVDSADRRMAWLLGLHEGYAILEPREQKRTKRGGWTQGRAVSLQKLAEQAEIFPYLTPQDRQICACIAREQESGWYGGYTRVSYQLDVERALIATVGHPLVIRPGAPDTPVEVHLGRPVLSVLRRSRDILVKIEPFPPDGRSVLPAEETHQRIRLFQFDAAHREVARILGASGLRVPMAAKERLLEGLSSVASILTVHSDIDGGDNAVETVLADLCPHLHLSPADGGLSLE